MDTLRTPQTLQQVPYYAPRNGALPASLYLPAARPVFARQRCVQRAGATVPRGIPAATAAPASTWAPRWPRRPPTVVCRLAARVCRLCVGWCVGFTVPLQWPASLVPQRFPQTTPLRCVGCVGAQRSFFFYLLVPTPTEPPTLADRQVSSSGKDRIRALRDARTYARFWAGNPIMRSPWRLSQTAQSM
jgi:hypothetical protein